jgi:hypothetical protein
MFRDLREDAIMKGYAAAALALLLTACTSTTEKQPAPPPILTSGNNTPVTLTDADRAAVEAAVRAAIPGGAGATFRTMIATQGPDGVVTLCGYVNALSGDKPYIGTLADEAFTMARIGGTDEEIIAVHGQCGKKGIHI